MRAGGSTSTDKEVPDFTIPGVLIDNVRNFTDFFTVRTGQAVSSVECVEAVVSFFCLKWSDIGWKSACIFSIFVSFRCLDRRSVRVGGSTLADKAAPVFTFPGAFIDDVRNPTGFFKVRAGQSVRSVELDNDMAFVDSF